MEYEYMGQLNPGFRLRGVPVNSTGGWLTNREWTASEPTDYTGFQGRVLQGRVDQVVTHTVRFDSTFRYLNYDRREWYHEPRGITTDGLTMTRAFRDQFRSNDDWSLTTNGYARVATDKLGTHNLVYGVEAYSQDYFEQLGNAPERERGGLVPGLSLRAPVYGLTNASLYRSTYDLNRVDARSLGFFGQDQIEILPKLQVLLGGRAERIRDHGVNNAFPLKIEDTAITGRVGAVYRAAPRVSIFGNVSNSYNRAPHFAQTPSANGPFGPETGRQVEGGVKSEVMNGRLLVTASVYHIVKKNVLRPDPAQGPSGNDVNAVFAVGRVRNQGFEIDATGRLTRRLNVIVNYSLLDSQILEDKTTPASVGKPLPNAARHSAGLYARYDFAKTGTAVTIGSEARSRRSQPYSDNVAGGYALLDLGLTQRIGKNLELRAQLNNAFDRFYATVTLFALRVGNMPGDPRTATVSLHFTLPARK